MLIALFLLGCLLGLGIGWFIGKGQTRWRVTEAVTQLESKARIEESKAAGFLEQLRRQEAGFEELRTALASEREAKAIALTRLEESVKNIGEQKKILESSQEKFKTTFEALSGEALKSNNQAFLDLAKKSLDAVLEGTKGEIAEKTNQIKSIVTPLEETLKRYEEQIFQFEKSRASDFGSLASQIHLLQKETNHLASALSTPHVRGRLGQSTLKRIVEFAGMVENCGFVEQVSVKTEEGRLQPDMILYLPGKRQLVVDSKFPFQAYDEYIQAVDENAREEALKKHVQQIRNHMKDLSSKKYWDQFPEAPDYVVMFIPIEASVNTALAKEPNLYEEGLASRVLICSPLSFYSQLIHYASEWRQEQVTKNAQMIAGLGKELFERFVTFAGNLNKTRDSLDQSIKNFNKTVGSLESRVYPTMRKFKELGIAGDAVTSIEPIEQAPRAVEGYESKESDPAAKDLFSAKP